jgi:hypothetical protein
VRPTGIPQAVLLTRVPAGGRGAARDARWDLTEAGYDVLQTEIPQNRAYDEDRYRILSVTALVLRVVPL